MGILTYFWVIEHVHVYRDQFNIIGRNEASFADGLLRARHQEIFIDHLNDNR